MSDTNCNPSMQQTHQPNPILEPLFHALDPISLILNQNSHSDQPVPLRLTPIDNFIMERGPRYKAYAELRETRLRMKCMMMEQQQQQQQESEELEPKHATPSRKHVKFQAGLASGTKKGSSVLAQSVPDFSAALRKENRKPMNTLPSLMEMTPPTKSSNKGNGLLSSSRGSKSASAGEKKKGGGGVLMARKSYASIDELKSLSSAMANAIKGEGRGGRSGRVMGRTGSGYYRQF